MVIAPGFPLYLWLLIVLIIVLVVLWFLFFQGEDGERDSGKHEETSPAKEEPESGQAAAVETEIDEELEFEPNEISTPEAAVDYPEESVGIIHVTDELEEGEPEEVVESAEAISAVEVDAVPDELEDEAEEDDAEDVIVFEGDLGDEPAAAAEAAAEAVDLIADEEAAPVEEPVAMVETDEAEVAAEAVDLMADEEAAPVDEPAAMVETDEAESVAESVESVANEEVAPVGEPVAAAAAELEEDPSAEDRLQIIEGIGPKIETVLKAAGVKTLRKLSGMSVESIRAILGEHQSLRLANPESWPEQARLAADGNKAALQELQDSLKGGRVVS